MNLADQIYAAKQLLAEVRSVEIFYRGLGGDGATPEEARQAAFGAFCEASR